MADEVVTGLKEDELRAKEMSGSARGGAQKDAPTSQVKLQTSTPTGGVTDMSAISNGTDSGTTTKSRTELTGDSKPNKVREPVLPRYEDLEGNDEEDDDDVDDDWVSEEGEESDVEDNADPPMLLRRRQSNPTLPDTVTLLTTHQGCKVYLVGTAHFSMESQEDVSSVIRAVQPDVVMVELCKSRINILELDEEMLLEEAKNISIQKMRIAVGQSGVVQGLMHLLLLSMSAHLTKQLGMAPGGEFRRAFHEARHVPGCRLQLGDRPIQITLKRALGALSVWQKVKLAWYLLTTKDPISKEDVEKCKQRDLLEQLLKEMTGEFPALSRVFVEERDVYLTHSLKMAAQPRDYPDMPDIGSPSVVVGVVGIGHVPGIVANWDQDQDISDIMVIPPGSMLGSVLRWGLRASLLCVVSYGCLRFYRWTSALL